MGKNKHYGCIEKIMDENHSLKTKVRELEISLANSHERERDLEEKIRSRKSCVSCFHVRPFPGIGKK